MIKKNNDPVELRYALTTLKVLMSHSHSSDYLLRHCSLCNDVTVAISNN